jgi:hypothetical protein
VRDRGGEAPNGAVRSPRRDARSFRRSCRSAHRIALPIFRHGFAFAHRFPACLRLAIVLSAFLLASLAAAPAPARACAGSTHGTPPMTMGTALQANDRQALQAIVDEFLAAQDPKEPAKVRMEKMRRWIAAQEGVASAELNPDLLDRDPPIREIWVTLEGQPATTRTIGISLDPRGFHFDIR